MSAQIIRVVQMSPVGSFRSNSAENRFDFASEFGNQGLTQQDFVAALSDSNSDINKTLLSLDPSSRILGGATRDGVIDAREAQQIAGNIFATQTSGIGNLDNDPLKLSSQEFLLALGLDSLNSTPDVGADTAPEEGGSVGESKQPDAAGSAGAAGAEQKQATKDWNGDGRIDMADYVFEQQLKAAAEAAGVPFEEMVQALEALAQEQGKSVMEIAKQFGGENGTIDSMEEVQNLMQAAGRNDSQGDSASNGLDALISSFGGGDNGIRTAA